MQKRTRDLQRVRRRPASVSRIAVGLSASPWAETASYGCRVRHVSASGVAEESAMQWCVHVRVRADGREGRSISGVAGKPTTTTASFRSRQRRENAGILAGLYSMIGIMGESSSPSTCTTRRATKPASFVLSARGRLALLMRYAWPIGTERLA